ncbi:MAG: VOC family protein [Chitinophagaceae bacterium]|nr:MAG: VOC family protein [Chitinophagaceae bacterium]
MQRIIPHLWFDKEASEAAAFYTSIFPESKVTNTTVMHNTPSGDCDVVNFTLWGQEFIAISAGPDFKFNPSISVMVNFDPLFFGGADKGDEAKAKLGEIWNKLSDGGTVMMELGEYPFSKRYGWIQDKYGFTWQLMLTDPSGEPRPAMVPSIMFVKENAGKAEEAMNHYLSVFKNTHPGAMHRYSAGMLPDKEGSVMYADFKLEGQWFAIMDSAHEHKFQFNEAVSLLVNCADQDEMDEYTEKLSAVPEAEQCGWIKDRYGLSWQISAAEMQEMMENGTPEQVERVVQTFLPMKRLNLAKIKAAYNG